MTTYTEHYFTEGKVREALTPEQSEELRLYEDYFDTAERANRLALPFEAWRLMKGRA